MDVYNVHSPKQHNISGVLRGLFRTLPVMRKFLVCQQWRIRGSSEGRQNPLSCFLDLISFGEMYKRFGLCMNYLHRSWLI